MFNKINKSSGAVSKVLLFLAVAILVVIIVIFIAIKISGNKKAQVTKDKTLVVEKVEPPKPVYDLTMQNIKFTFKSAENLGSVLKAKTTYEQDLKTTEKFIKIVVGAQNKSKTNLVQYAWDIGNIVDADGREFTPYDKAFFYLPKPDLCGAILKPEFEPIPCIKIYEVSKLSKNLKIQIKVTDPKIQMGLLDVVVK